MRLIRKYRLDDPRITDEVRAVHVRAALNRLKTPSRARHRTLCPQTAAVQPNEATHRKQTPESSSRPPQASRNVCTSEAKPVSIDLVRKGISDRFYMRELRDEELRVYSDRQIFVFPRQLAMYLARQLTTASLPEIGRQFGRHHTTVLHSINRIEKMRRSDKEFDRAIARLMDELRVSC